jgi:hypothetical protein
MMKIKELVLKELDTLAPDELLLVYDVLIAFKNAHSQEVKMPFPAEYLKVREALKTCKGSFVG